MRKDTEPEIQIAFYCPSVLTGTCPGGIAARAAVPDVAGWGGMAARAGAGSAGGASSSGDQVAASSACGTSSVNVFQGSERPSARTSTKAGLFKKIDGLVYPGRDGKEATDTKEKWERFEKCDVDRFARRRFWVLAHVCPPTKDGGEKRIRHLAITLQEYDTLQEGTSRPPRTCWTVIHSPLVSPPF